MRPTPLQRALFEARLRQLDIVLRTGTRPGDVSYIVRGLKTPSPELKARISQIVNVPVDKLWPPVKKQSNVEAGGTV